MVVSALSRQLISTKIIIKHNIILSNICDWRLSNFFNFWPLVFISCGWLLQGTSLFFTFRQKSYQSIVVSEKWKTISSHEHIHVTQKKNVAINSVGKVIDVTHCRYSMFHCVYHQRSATIAYVSYHISNTADSSFWVEHWEKDRNLNGIKLMKFSSVSIPLHRLQCVSQARYK